MELSVSSRRPLCRPAPSRSHTRVEVGGRAGSCSHSPACTGGWPGRGGGGAPQGADIRMRRVPGTSPRRESQVLARETQTEERPVVGVTDVLGWKLGQHRTRGLRGNVTPLVNRAGGWAGLASGPTPAFFGAASQASVSPSVAPRLDNVDAPFRDGPQVCADVPSPGARGSHILPNRILSWLWRVLAPHPSM